VISGMLAGMILGDYRTGMLAGAAVNFIYIDFVSTGGSFKGDQCLTAIIAAVSAIIFKLSFVESSAFSYIFGFAGILIWKYRLNINSVFVRKYEEKYKDGMKPDIAFYDGLLPQALLYLMSTAVLFLCFFVMVFIKGIFEEYLSVISPVLNLAGMFLIFSSVFKLMLKMKNRRAVETAALLFVLVIIFDVNSLMLFAAFIILLLSLCYDEISLKKRPAKNEGAVIRKKDLLHSWFTWMNFSHACYSYERLQGMAFAHSMKNIANRLYADEQKRSEAIHRHSDFFNTEPNMGTPIHGYVISLEEQMSLGKEAADIQYIKKGLMGAAAGLGDSFTQVVLTPLFISVSILLCLDGKFVTAVIPVVILCSTIIAISYRGWMDGYYAGKESLIRRISSVKKSRVKIYFLFIFAGILGASLAKLILSVISSGQNEKVIIAAAFISVLSEAFKKYKRNIFEDKYGN
jgi:PTS system mannose-specific IID component